jgi:hypothetical protein
MVDIYEDDLCFHLGSTGTDIDSVGLRYWSHPVDENGVIKIPEEHLYAIMIFVKYMNAERQGSSRLEISSLNREWKIQAAKIRGADKMPNQIEAREIITSWMSLIPKGVSTKYDTY